MAFTPSENPITHPTRESYTVLRPFRFWCQKVLPLVYDDSLSYYELLCKVVDYLNKTMEDVDHMNTDIETLYENFQEFQEGTIRIYNELVAYVNTYFDELDVQDEINNKLDAMVTSGELVTILQPSIADEVSSWLSEHITPTTPAIDDTLTVSGAGADAKVVGDALSDLKSSFNNFNDALVTSDINLIKLVDKTVGKIYERNDDISVNELDNQYGSIYKPIDIEENTTYYYRNLYGYFCKIVYNDNTFEYLKDDSYAYANGNFTPTKNGKIYITSHNSASGIILFCTNQDVYNIQSDGWFLPNLLKTPSIYPLIITDNSVVSDLNLLTDNAVYRIQINGTAPSNLPSNATSGMWLLFVHSSYAGNNKQTLQFLFNYQSKKFMYMRNAYNNNSVWSAWTPMDSTGLTVYCGASEQFTRLRDAVAYAREFKNSTVIVRAGTYDLISEFAEEINASTNTQFGVLIDNGVRIIFDGGAKVVAEYEGSDTNILHNFSPFLAGEISGGFTLENLDIKTKNTRYCVHDDTGNYDIVSIHKYINCRMVHDDTENTIKSYPQCIGGGFGNHTYIEIRDCYFKSLGSENWPNPLVSYHNNATFAYAKSDVFISNCYFSGQGTYRTTHLGNSTEVSLTTINNTSLGSTPQNRHEINGATTPENTAIFQYMNEIRN